MINRAHRFHGYNSVLPVYKKAQAVRGGDCSLHYAPNRRKTYRLAVVISKKVAKSAVQRNRIRRRVYEIMRHNLRDDTRYDLIITVYDANLGTMSANEAEKVITNLLEKAALTLDK